MYNEFIKKKIKMYYIQKKSSKKGGKYTLPQKGYSYQKYYKNNNKE